MFVVNKDGLMTDFETDITQLKKTYAKKPFKDKLEKLQSLFWKYVEKAEKEKSILPEAVNQVLIQYFQCVENAFRKKRLDFSCFRDFYWMVDDDNQPFSKVTRLFQVTSIEVLFTYLNSLQRLAEIQQNTLSLELLNGLKNVKRVNKKPFTLFQFFKLKSVGYVNKGRISLFQFSEHEFTEKMTDNDLNEFYRYFQNIYQSLSSSFEVPDFIMGRLFGMTPLQAEQQTLNLEFVRSSLREAHEARLAEFGRPMEPFPCKVSQ